MRSPPDSVCAIRPWGVLSIQSTLADLAVGRTDPSFRFLDGGGVVWASRTPAGPVTLVIHPDGGAVETAAWGPGTDWALDRLPALLGQDDDHDPIETDHPRLRDAIRRAQGLRLARAWSVADVLVPKVLQQLVTGTEAGRAYHALMRSFAQEAPGPLGMWLRPPSDRLKGVPWEVLCSFGASRKAAETLIELSRVPGRMEEILTMDAAAARQRLMAVRGIGPWTAASVMVGCFGFPDEVATADYHHANTVAWFFDRVPRADDATMLRLLEPYRGQRGRVLRIINAYGESAPKYGPRHRIRERW
jgi:3-methyladenine DNA glycosylase/8-oxoguanine DNA glycosylase